MRCYVTVKCLHHQNLVAEVKHQIFNAEIDFHIFTINIILKWKRLFAVLTQLHYCMYVGTLNICQYIVSYFTRI
jgi:hypothetical protein